jgi:RNA polymerase sigma-70 factor (ECF subfamily)
MSATAIVEVAPAAEFELPYDGQLQTCARAVPALRLDAVSRAWWVRLHETGPVRDCAIAELHERLRREARFQIRLRTRGMSEFPGSDLDDLAVMAADDALLAVLRKLEDYRGESQFWTWARRFAQLEAPVSIRRRMGHDHVAHDPEQAFAIPDPGCSQQERVEIQELLRKVSDLIVDVLTTRQRAVLIAIAIDGTSTATLAIELDTTPGAIYKTLHDARKKLTAQLAPAPSVSGDARRALGRAALRPRSTR